MNFKTTVILFVAVIAVGASIVFLKEKAPPARATFTPPPFSPGAGAEEDLIDKDFGDVVRVTVHQPDKPDWQFAKSDESDSDAAWTMTAPYEQRVQKWQVEQIPNTLTSLTYALKYDPKTDSPSLKDAGLDPPRATYVLTSQNDDTITVHVGRPEGSGETYVALNDDNDTVYLVKRSLKHLMKDSPLDYFDKKLFTVKTDNIVRIDVTTPPSEQDGTAGQTLELVKTGGQWMFDKPFNARAMSDKIIGLCNSFATLNVVKWVADDVDSPDLYGLGDPAVTVTFHVEEPAAPSKVEQDDGDTDNANKNAGESEEAEETGPPVIKQYTLCLSSVSPLDDKTKVYARRGDEKLVGTVMKSLADKFTPDLKEWRDNRITTIDALTARRVELVTDGQSATLVRSGNNWTFESTQAPADRTEMETLLRKISELRALNFAEDTTDLAGYGLEAPRGKITLTFDGKTVPQTILIGGFADETTKQLVYVRAGDGRSVAKIRASDANFLLRDPSAYRDRTVVSIGKDRFTEFHFQRRAEGAEPSAGDFALAKTDNGWRMTAPVGGDIDDKTMTKFLDTIADLHGQKVVDATGGLAGFGLADPPIKLAYTYLPPEIIRMEPVSTNGDENANGAAPKMQPNKYQPPPETLHVGFSRSNDKVYAVRDENPQVVYILGAGVYDVLTAEFRSAKVFDFEASQATAVTFREGNRTQGFRKTDDGWAYEPEPDIPVDDKKITGYFLRVADTKNVGFAEYNATDLAKYDLDNPKYELTIEVEGETLPTLLLSQKTTEGGGRYAKLADASDVFFMPPDILNRIGIDITEFEPD